MKSPMITSANYIKDKERYSELQVCHSAAGYYIGTIYHHPDGFDEPGSRDSDYYATKEEAEHDLKLLELDDENKPRLRKHP